MNGENMNYQGLYSGESKQTAEQQVQPEEHFSAMEQVGAFLAMLAGFLFIRFSLHHVNGVFTTLFYWFLITTETVFVKKSGRKFSKTEIVMVVVLYLFSCVYTVTANTTMKVFTTIFIILDNGIFLLGMNSGLNVVLRFLPSALLTSALALPLADTGKCFKAVKSSKGNGTWKNAWYVLGGLLITLPLTCLIATLLCKSDENMSAMIGQFLKIPPEELLILVPELAFGILIGIMIYSAMYTTTHKKNWLNSDDCEQKVQYCRFIPNLMLYSAVTPVCILYILYAVSQVNYFMGGIVGVLAEGYTYAEYAREGFFELCAVCCINLAVIGAIGFFAKKTGEEKPLMLKIYSVFLCLCSLFLAGTAVAKMLMYIQYYGMTRLRIYTTWFMFLLIIGFFVLMLRQFRHSLNIGKTAYFVFVIMFGLLVFSRPDEWITRYNANQYLSGNLKEFDSAVVYHMSIDAWAGLSSYSEKDLQKLNVEYYDTSSWDFYNKLNLSAWEIMENAK